MPNQLSIIFDNFILKGISLILKLILAIIEHQKWFILNLYDDELLEYMKHEIYEDCLTKTSVTELLKKDFNLLFL